MIVLNRRRGGLGTLPPSSRSPPTADGTGVRRVTVFTVPSGSPTPKPQIQRRAPRPPHRGSPRDPDGVPAARPAWPAASCLSRPRASGVSGRGRRCCSRVPRAATARVAGLCPPELCCRPVRESIWTPQNLDWYEKKKYNLNPGLRVLQK